MVFGVYLHFVLLCDEYHIFTNIFFNHLISIKNVIYFEKNYYLGVELLYYEYNFWKKN
jgi:hypothetical protein